MWRVIAVNLLCGVGSVGSVGGVRRARDVLTTQGAARGYFVSHPPHYVYLGLPYAGAPTRQRRFKAPEPPRKWDGLFEATHRVKCPQNGRGEENCLVINVFTPAHEESHSVIVVVHGGNYQTGWGTYEAPFRLLKQDFVVVTFNYRLGVLGFLCLGTPSAPGNVGLKDQVAALYWVQRNIAQFGGNPDDVTVYGNGSGAEAVQLLLLSGLTEGLLHKVILESGSVLSPTAITYKPVEEATEAALNLGFNETESETLDNFYQTTPAKILTNTPHIFIPCIENQYETTHSLLEKDPYQILKEGTFQKVPMLMMYKHTDGTDIMQGKSDFHSFPEHFEHMLPNNLQSNDEVTKTRIAELVKEFYFIKQNMEQNYANYFHDVLYNYPIMKFSILYATNNTNPIYVLKFTFNNKKNEESTHLFEKVIDYFYANDNLEDDEVFAEQFIALFNNFIKLSDPTPITTSFIPIIWEPLSGDPDQKLRMKTASILTFDGTMRMVRNQDQRLLLWDHIYDSFYRIHSFPKTLPDEEIDREDK